MELKQLQYFVTSVDLGSFKKAADALYTTQPHVSKTIKALEDELGLTLFDRHPVGVTITEAGKQVYTHASDILRRCGQIAQVEADGGCEPLHVAATPSGFLADLTAKFCRDRQALDLRYHEGSMEDILQKLHRHEANLGLVTLTRRKLAGFGQIIDKKRLTLEVLCEDSPCLFVGADHPLRQAGSVDAAALRTLSFIQPPDGLFALQPSALIGQDADSPGRIQTNSPLLSRRLTETGAACVIGCRWMFPEDCTLHPVPIARCEERICLGLVKRGRGELSDAEREFVAFLRQQLS